LTVNGHSEVKVADMERVSTEEHKLIKDENQRLKYRIAHLLKTLENVEKKN